MKKGKVYTVVLDENIVEKAREKAEKLGLSFSAYIRVALVEKIEKRR